MTLIFATEVLQFIVAFIGLLIAHWNLWVAVEDAVEMSGQPEITNVSNTVKITALRSVSREIVLLMASGLLTLIGLVALLLDTYCPTPWSHALQNILLIVLSLLLLLDAVMERHSRLAFDAVLERRQNWTLWDSLTLGWRRKIPRPQPESDRDRS